MALLNWQVSKDFLWQSQDKVEYVVLSFGFEENYCGNSQYI